MRPQLLLVFQHLDVVLVLPDIMFGLHLLSLAIKSFIRLSIELYFMNSVIIAKPVRKHSRWPSDLPPSIMTQVSERCRCTSALSVYEITSCKEETWLTAGDSSVSSDSIHLSTLFRLIFHIVIFPAKTLSEQLKHPMTDPYCMSRFTGQWSDIGANGEVMMWLMKISPEFLRDPPKLRTRLSNTKCSNGNLKRTK